MSKLAVDINKGLRLALRAGKRGQSYYTVDKDGEINGRVWRRGCFCLSRGLMDENELCPAHGRVIGSHPARTQNLGLRR